MTLNLAHVENMDAIASISILPYIYIYIYMCVCVCACVYVRVEAMYNPELGAFLIMLCS
jgi:hypothetical protein